MADMANATNETDFRTILNDVRGMLFNAMALHEKSEHNGQPCFNERVNSIAWLAHALGLTVDNLQQLGELLSDYERTHHQHDHSNSEARNVGH